MKERLTIHFVISFVYTVLTRNLIGDYFYSTSLSQFQYSLVYSGILAVFLTILLELWCTLFQMYLYRRLGIMFFIVLGLFILMAVAQAISIYYTLIVGYILFFIVKDIWRILSINEDLNNIKKM